MAGGALLELAAVMQALEVGRRPRAAGRRERAGEQEQAEVTAAPAGERAARQG
jgi:hypothetical protein